ncbi:MAG: alpha/beta hydrolase [Actinomycetota bacterium]|nr:alpha/beta hydrolase [Actinomycetota bacterium]
MPALTESLALHTSDGLELAAEIAQPAGTPPRSLMVLCHPHPQYGGNMHATVIDWLFRQLPVHDVALLRFNFRGVPGSGGSHDEGVGERLDVRAAIDELGGRWPDLPLIVGGWSFGADVSLAVDHPRHSGWFSVAPPLAVVRVSDMVAPTDPRPKLLAVPEHDQFNPPAKAATTTESWTSTLIEVVPNADHFLAGGLSRVLELARSLSPT